MGEGEKTSVRTRGKSPPFRFFNQLVLFLRAGIAEASAAFGRSAPVPTLRVYQCKGCLQDARRTGSAAAIAAGRAYELSQRMTRIATFAILLQLLQRTRGQVFAGKRLLLRRGAWLGLFVCVCVWESRALLWSIPALLRRPGLPCIVSCTFCLPSLFLCLSHALFTWVGMNFHGAQLETKIAEVFCSRLELEYPNKGAYFPCGWSFFLRNLMDVPLFLATGSLNVDLYDTEGIFSLESRHSSPFYSKQLVSIKGKGEASSI